MWILVVILFSVGQPADTKLLLAQTEQECNSGRQGIAARAASHELQIWMSPCMEVPAPPAKEP